MHVIVLPKTVKLVPLPARVLKAPSPPHTKAEEILQERSSAF